MKERIIPGSKDKLGNNKRLAITDITEKKTQVREYSPSQTERLLEEICLSFKTELKPAYVNPLNGAKLVRLSKPVILTHKETGGKSLLAMQSTRFSPFFDQNEVARIYNNMDPKKEDSEEETLTEIEEEIRKRDDKDNSFRAVTDRNYIPRLSLARWRKEIYFAVFSLDAVPTEEVKPFMIREYGIGGPGLPDVHLVFRRQPLYLNQGSILNHQRKDSLSFDFPRISRRHDDALGLASSLLFPDKQDLKSGLTPRTSATYDIDPKAPVTRTMAFIQRYLQRITQGTTL